MKLSGWLSSPGAWRIYPNHRTTNSSRPEEGSSNPGRESSFHLSNLHLPVKHPPHGEPMNTGSVIGFWPCPEGRRWVLWKRCLCNYKCSRHSRDVPWEPLAAPCKRKQNVEKSVAVVWHLLPASDGAWSRNSGFCLSVLAAAQPP